MKELVKRIAKALDKKAVILCERSNCIIEFALVDKKLKRTTDFISIIYSSRKNRYMLCDYQSLVSNFTYIDSPYVGFINMIIDDYNKEINEND